jgi:hypothetical protein
MVDAAEAAEIDLILEYCGFTDARGRTDIAADGFESYDDITSLTDKDIASLSKGFAERTAAQGKINFGLRRTNLLKATIHWAKDFLRVSREPSLDGIVDREEFKEALEIARQRAVIRQHNADESAQVSKSADPGKLKRQKDWVVWSRSLENYLSTIMGQDGVPLSYIIRAEDAPDYAEEDEPDPDFEKMTISAAPLTGLVFKTDARKVHQLIHGFVQGEIAETWIKPKEKKQNGRLDFKALQAHYGGEGNKSVRIKEAEVLRKTLHYKNERAMSFEKFLTNMQAMFTGFADNEEILTDAQKIRLLFEKVQCPSLNQVKSSLQVSYDLDQAGDVTFDFIANSMAAEAASLPEYSQARNTSEIDTGGRSGSAPTSGVKMADGSIFTGFYPNFHDLEESQKQIIYDERKRLGIVSKKAKHSSNRNGKSNRKTSATKSKDKAIKKMTREIASMKSKFKDMEKKGGSSKSSDDDEVQDNAGDQFGGRKTKKAKKDGE